MKLRQFLTTEEIDALRDILWRSRLFSSDEEAARRDWLVSAGVEHPQMYMKLSADSVAFMDALMARFGDIELKLARPSGVERRLGVIIVIEYIVTFDAPFTPTIVEEDIELLQQIILKYEEWRASPPAATRQDQIRSALSSRRAAGAASPAPRRTFRVDLDTIISFDLKAQINAFSEKLQLAGAFPYALCGPHHILENYVVERIKRTLDNEVDQRSLLKYVRVWLYQHTYSGAQNGFDLIFGEVKRNYKDFALLADFFERERMDVLLVVWNFDVPPPEAKEIAASFWREAYAQLAPVIKGQSSRFIFLWVNVNSLPLGLPDFHAIPPLTSFETEDIEIYFRDRLLLARVDPAEIECILAQLTRHKGHLEGTYQEMKSLVESFSREAEPT